MIRLIGVWLVVCDLLVTPVAADEDQYDGPTAIRAVCIWLYAYPAFFT